MVSLEASVRCLRITLRDTYIRSHKIVGVSAAKLSHIIRGRMTVSVGALLCYTIASFVVALTIAKIFAMSQPDAIEYLKWSYNDVKMVE